MPIYLYKCKRCGRTMEMLRKMSDKDNEVVCAACGAKEMEKLAAPFFSSMSGAGPFSFG
jgi:putative FmdB family regulatory protein